MHAHYAPPPPHESRAHNDIHPLPVTGLNNVPLSEHGEARTNSRDSTDVILTSTMITLPQMCQLRVRGA
jgi:hypothetical protein